MYEVEESMLAKPNVEDTFTVLKEILDLVTCILCFWVHRIINQGQMERTFFEGS